MGDNQDQKKTLTDIKRVDRVSIRARRTSKGAAMVKDALIENKSMLMLFAVIVAALAVILISILGFGIAAVPVCVIVVIEASLAVCLNNEQVWLHGLVVLAQIVAGILCGNTVFIILCAAIYVLSIFTLRFIRD